MVRMPMGLRRPSPSSASSILVVSSAMSVAQARPCEVSAISISRLLAGDDEGAVPAHQIAHHPLLVEPHAGFEEKLQGLCPLVALEGVQGAFGRGYQTLVEGREEPLAGGSYGERGVSVVIVAGSLLKGSLPHELSGAGGHRGVVEPERRGGRRRGLLGAFADEQQ